MSTPTPDPRRWIALALLCATQFMVVLDVSIVNVALPSIDRALHFGTGNLQWVASAYALTFGGFLLLGGRAADLLGRRRVFMVGLVLFSAASLACGLSNSSGTLIAARAIQGFGAAIVSPAALSIISTTFSEGEERNKALAIWGAIAGTGGAAGVLLGGILVDKVGWEWIFFINVPIGAAVVALAPRILHESRVEGAPRRFDVAGAVTVTASLMLLVFATVKTTTHSWGSPLVLSLLAGSALLMVAFVVIERRAEAPLVPFRIFRNRTLTGANIVGMLLGAAIFSQFFILSLYMQDVLGYSPLQAGVAYLLIAGTIIVAAGASQALVGRLGLRTVLAAGGVFLAVGQLLFAQISVDGTYLADLAPGFVVAGIGLGFCFVPDSIAALHRVTERDAGLASGLINTSQQIGGALGVAVLATIATNHAESALSSGSTTNPQQALVDGWHLSFLVGAVLAVALVAVAWTMIRDTAAESPAGEPAPVAES
jgi:EmrB/QacA subfamily drug resistance transporter